MKKKQTNLIKLDGEMPIKEALGVLAANKILSVPVWDKLDGNWLGFLDCNDVVAFASGILTKGKDIAPDDWTSYQLNCRNQMHCEVTFSTLPIKKIMNASKKDLFIPVYQHGTIYQLIEDVFFKGVHRVPIFDDVSSDKLLDIVSQSDVLNYLGHHMDFLDKLGDRTVEKLNLGSRGAVMAPINIPAIHAFYLMDKHKVSAVAVVNPANGVLLANLSVADIRGLSENKFQTLLGPIHHFFLASKGTIVPPVTCSLNTDFGSVVRKIVYFRIHRVWITDTAGKPIGVISLTDVMKVLTLLQEEPIAETPPVDRILHHKTQQAPATTTAL